MRVLHAFFMFLICSLAINEHTDKNATGWTDEKAGYEPEVMTVPNFNPRNLLPFQLLRSLSNDDGDGNENVKKKKKKKKKLNARALHFLVHFFAVTARLRTWNFLTGRTCIMEDVNKRRRIFLCLSRRGCGLQEFNSMRKFHQHLTFKAFGNNRDDVRKSHEFILIVTFSLPSSLLKLPG